MGVFALLYIRYKISKKNIFFAKLWTKY